MAHEYAIAEVALKAEEPITLLPDLLPPMLLKSSCSDSDLRPANSLEPSFLQKADRSLGPLLIQEPIHLGKPNWPNYLALKEISQKCPQRLQVNPKLATNDVPKRQ